MKQESYRNSYIIEHAKGFDVVDKSSGRWFVCKTRRQARWNATVFARLQHQFGYLPTMPEKRT